MSERPPARLHPADPPPAAPPRGLARYRVAFGAALARRRGRVVVALLVWLGSLVAPAMCAAPLVWHSAFGERVRMVGVGLLGVAAAAQYLGAVRIMRGLRGVDLVAVVIGGTAPLWGVIAGLLALCVGGPVVCSLVWGAALGVAYGEGRGIVVGLIVGVASMIGGVVGLVVEGVAPVPMPEGFMLVGAVWFWHLAHGPLLLVVSCERAWSRWRDVSRCAHCDYDLRGLPADAERCPECGEVVEVYQTVLPGVGVASGS